MAAAYAASNETNNITLPRVVDDSTKAPGGTPLSAKTRIVDGGLRRAGVVYHVQDNAASIVSFIEQRDLVRARRDGKVEVPPGPSKYDGNGDPCDSKHE